MHSDLWIHQRLAMCTVPHICTRTKQIILEQPCIWMLRNGHREVLLKFFPIGENEISIYTQISCFLSFFLIVLKYLVNAGWTSWGSWSSCTQICQSGTKQRNRQCAGSRPKRAPKTAQYGGERDCSGNSWQWVYCNTHKCNGEFS